MNKRIATILAASVFVMSGQAAWANCAAAKIIGDTWHMTGIIIYDRDGSVRPVWCSSLEITAGPASNAIKMHGLDCKERTSSGWLDMLFGAEVTVNPKSCRVVGTASWLTGGRLAVQVKIRSANFQNPQGIENSAAADVVGDVIAFPNPPGNGVVIGAMSFSLMR